MATTVDTLITKYVLDPSGYARATSVVHRQTTRIADAQKQASAASRAFQRQLTAGLNSGATVAKAFAGTMVAATAAFVGAGAAAMVKGAEYEALAKSLEAVEGSAAKAAAQMERLRDMAKAPGLGLKESIEGYVQLRQAGIGQGLTERMIKEFANKNALAGGGQEEFGRIMRAVSQIATAPYLQGDELRQLQEARIPAYRMVADAFGTSNTEELKSRGITSGQVLAVLVAELEKMPRVGESAKTSIENFADSLEVSVAGVGQGLNKTFMPILDSLSASADKASKSGIFESLGEQIAASISNVFGGGMDSLSSENIWLEIATATAVTAELLGNVYMNLQDIGKGIWFLVDSFTQGLLGRVAKPAALDSFDEIMERQRTSIRAGAKAAMLGKAIAARSIRGEGELGKTGIERDNPLRSIESNTRRTADHTAKMAQLTDSIFGGGDIGRKGLSAVDVNSIKGRGAQGNVRGGDRIQRAAQVLGDIFNEGFMEGIVSAKKNGLLN